MAKESDIEAENKKQEKIRKEIDIIQRNIDEEIRKQATWKEIQRMMNAI